MITGTPLLNVEQVQDRVRELAAKISEDYEGRQILAVGILKGAFMFFSDLVKHIQVPMEIDFLLVSSYHKTESTEEMNIHADLREDIRDRHVLLIEDIIDTGLTLNFLKTLLLERNPASLKVCAFLDKKPRRKADIKIDYTGFEVPDEYLVGYGLDYENKYRNLPHIAIFKKEHSQG